MWEGKITKILFQDDDLVIAILRAKDKKDIKIIGNIINLVKGDYIKIEGEVEHHPNYGEQIRVTRWEKPFPTTAIAIIKFLTSSGIKGIGPARAKKIVEKLGNNAIERIITEGPDLLRTIPGLKNKSQEIYESILEKYEYQLILQELLPLGISEKALRKTYGYFGSKTISFIKNNPYRLLRFRLITFFTADKIAEKIGIEATFFERIQAALIQCFNNNYYKGHCYLNKNYLISSSLQILNKYRRDKVSKEDIAEVIEKSDLFVAEEEHIYTFEYFKAETNIAKNIANLYVPASIPVNLKEAIFSYEKNNKLILALKQKEAIQALFSNNFLIITGGPGTGKTETIRSIVKIYQKIYPRNKIALISPTGRGARRLSEICEEEAYTVHRLIGMRPWEKPKYNKKDPLPYQLIIIDEASMLDLWTANYLFEAIAPKTKVLMVGDKDQLPPVGPGQVLADLLKVSLPITYLSEVFRQATESQIVKNAHNILFGNDIEIDPSKKDFFYITQESPHKILEITKKAVIRLIEKGYSIDDIQVLTPMREPTVGVNSLNKLLQSTFQQSNSKKIKTKNGLFYVGDKVIQNENNYHKDVYNGDIGTIEKIAPIYDDEEEVIHVRFNGRTVTYTQDEMDQLSLAYATTIHKAQGGEMPAVIIALSNEHDIMLTRNLLYTAVTRAKEFVCIIGPRKALQKAIRNNRVYQKNSGLSKRINMLLEEQKKQLRLN